MKVLRTPDERFVDLPDFGHEPRYTVVPRGDGEGEGLRIHHVEAGPEDGPTVLLMHGQPTWSFLYRRMIPVLAGRGMRVLAPDLVGYGRSDKPSERDDYTYQRQGRLAERLAARQRRGPRDPGRAGLGRSDRTPDGRS